MQVIGLLSVILVNMIINLNRIFQGRNKLLRKHHYYERGSIQEIACKKENPER